MRTQQEWRELVFDEDFDGHDCAAHKAEFAGIVRELLTEDDALFVALDELLYALDNEEGTVLFVKAADAVEKARTVIDAAFDAALKGEAHHVS
jgi:hypothetical protein